MMDTVLVTVIIPTHNRSVMLKKAINSVVNQTISNIEILVCDDASDDDTKQIVEELSELDARIKYFYLKSGRPAGTRNVGLKNAKGKYIAFLDDDDEWYQNKLEVQLKLMEEYNVGLCCSNALRFDGLNNNEDYFSNSKERVIRLNQLYRYNPVICSSLIFDSVFLQKVGFFPEGDDLIAIEDYAYWFRLFSLNDGIYTNSNLVKYLIDSKTSIRKKKTVTFKEQKRFVLSDYHLWLYKQNMSTKLYSMSQMVIGNFINCYDHFLGILKKIYHKFKKMIIY